MCRGQMDGSFDAIEMSGGEERHACLPAPDDQSRPMLEVSPMDTVPRD